MSEVNKAEGLLKLGFSKQYVRKKMKYLPEPKTESGLDFARRVAKEYPELIKHRDWNGIAWKLFSEYKLSPFKAFHATKNLMTFHCKKKK